MSGYLVTAKNISLETSDEEVRKFFSFLGKISSFNVKSAGSTKEAEVSFVSKEAAELAVSLNGTAVLTHPNNLLEISSDVTSTSGDDHKHQAERDSDEITQEEKPRSRIIAEYLAHGYVIKDSGIQKAIDLDHKHGVSDRFLKTLTDLNTKYHATDKAKAVDQSYAITPKVNNFLSGLSSYYEKAADTPTGQKLVNFYTSTQKQVADIHNEAQRLADLKKKETAGTPTEVTESGKTTCKCGSDSGSCPCAPGACACTNCAKSEVKTVPGTDKTTCNCGGKTSDCPCKEGHCACSSCPKASASKNEVKTVPGTSKTTCNCGGKTSNCPCKEGQCACSSCPKASLEKVAGEKTKCSCGGNEGNCACEAGKCACNNCDK